MSGPRPLNWSSVLPALVLTAGMTLSPAIALAQDSELASQLEDRKVNVSFSFSTRIPVPDFAEATISKLQDAWHERIYRMARKECSLLTATIAETCRLTDVGLSADLDRRSDPVPLFYLDGNASFTIVLRDDATGG